MPALVALATVKEALRVTETDDDDLLTAYILAASQAIIRHLKAQASEVIDLDALAESPPDYTGVPDDIQIAATILAGHFYREPDGDIDKAYEDAELPRPVRSLLRMMRDPSLA